MARISLSQEIDNEIVYVTYRREDIVQGVVRIACNSSDTSCRVGRKGLRGAHARSDGAICPVIVSAALELDVR